MKNKDTIIKQIMSLRNEIENNTMTTSEITDELIEIELQIQNYL